MGKTSFHKDRLDLLFYWVRERETARKNKEAGKKPPWTKEPILQSARFCNVRRMDDKVSKWLLEHWYPKKVSQNQQLANAGMARLINWPDSLAVMKKAKLHTKWDADKALDVLYGIRRDSGKLFTGAYIINGIAKQDKVVTVVNQFDSLYRQPNLVDATSMQRTHKQLQTVLGIGSFIGGQIVADLRHVWNYKGATWDDRMTWAPLGPGSRRGIAWLLGWDGKEELKTLPLEQFDAHMTELMSLFGKRVPAIMKDRSLEMHDIQNTLCEYDKFMRVKHSTGRAKNSFAGT